MLIFIGYNIDVIDSDNTIVSSRNDVRKSTRNRCSCNTSNHEYLTAKPCWQIPDCKEASKEIDSKEIDSKEIDSKEILAR